MAVAQANHPTRGSLASPTPAPSHGWWVDGALCAAATAASVILLSLTFPPRTLWPLTLIALTPWCYAACRSQRAWPVYWSSYLGGYVFFAWNLAWLMPVTGLGYIALAGYLAVYWPLAIWAVRTGRRLGASAAWTLPAAWVACELLRGWVMTGFPWLLVAHGLYGQTLLIQICDLVGAYGVSFLAVMGSAVIAEGLLTRVRRGVRRLPRQLLAGCAVWLILAAGTLTYGSWRLSQHASRPGPPVAVVQHDFLMRSEPPFELAHYIFSAYMEQAAAASRDRPAMVVFPETAWGFVQNESFLRTPLQAVDGVSPRAATEGLRAHQATAAFARGAYAEVNETIAEWEALARRIRNDGTWIPRRDFPRLPEEGGPPVTLVVGAISIEVLPDSALTRLQRFNSALLYEPDGRQRAQRYDKKHLVPFGEIVPFRNQRLWGVDLHPLYRWLNKLSPFSQGGTREYSLTPGGELTVFDLDFDGQRYRFGTPICYEDVMPYLIRDYVWKGGRRRVDFLVNISNDGWFLHSAELPQHLAICVFRAVENRVSIARSVNTGISGFIDANGRVLATLGVAQVGHLTQRVMIDERDSFYGRTGDWFAGLCLAASAGLWCWAVFSRWILGGWARLAQVVAKRNARHANTGN